jgi:hypothetical protein
MEWKFTNILILLGVLFAGYAIGLLEMHLRRQKKIRRLEAALQAEQAKAEPPAEAAPVTAPAPVPAAPVGPGGLRLWNDDSGTLKMELDNITAESPATLTPEHRRRIIHLLTQVRPWLEGGPVTSPALSSQSAPATAAVKIVEPPAVPVLKSIVGQINDVLQARLPGTPLASRKVRMGETPTGDVLVFIGETKYEGIDAVPDPEVVAAIRAAIKEWEKKVG